MNQEASFSYHYSAQDTKEVESIRKKYLPREENKLTQLKALDTKVKRPAYRFAILFGILSALVMGCGMSLVMTDLSEILRIPHPMVTGIAIGLAGLFMGLLTHPIFKGILHSRRRKFADKIIALSDQIMKG